MTSAEQTRYLRGALLSGAVLLLAATSAEAHVPMLRGRLIDLVSQSDLVVVGTVEKVDAIDARTSQTTLRVDARFLGDTPDTRVTFRALPRVAPGQRYLFFLRRAGAGLECMQPSGTVFPARPDDDAAYRATIAAVQRALRAGDDERPAALRAAMIPALSASAPPLRYHAILELGALAHHGLAESERRSLERLLADPATDPAIEPLIASLLRTAAEASSTGGQQWEDTAERSPSGGHDQWRQVMSPPMSR